MIVIIAYDIADHRRRRRVADTLSEIGWRLQESVFECHIDSNRTEHLNRTLHTMIDAQTDVIHVFRQCRNCHERRSPARRVPHVDSTHWCA